MSNLAATLREVGELRDALELYEFVLAVRCDVLPKGHPDIFRVAWYLFHNLMVMNEPNRATEILCNHLLPLRSYDPDTLPSQLRDIREEIVQMLEEIERNRQNEP
jgi:hypothetical protein